MSQAAPDAKTPAKVAAPAAGQGIASMKELCFQLMRNFVVRTGLVNPQNPPTTAKTQTRHLRTDSLAICALVSLSEAELANRLADQINWTLGRTADGKQWISGLSDREGAQRPTVGGVRIGNPLPERDPSLREPEHDEGLRDGVFLHCLTLYLRALRQLGRKSQANDLGHAIARICHAGMYWKVRTGDLTKPLIRCRSKQDAVESVVALSLVQDWNEARWIGQTRCISRCWTTGDVLTLGAMLISLSTLHQLGLYPELQHSLRRDALKSLQIWWETEPLEVAGNLRVCFRECSLVLGLLSVAADSAFWRFQAVVDRIRQFWSTAENRQTPHYMEHQDINDVSLCLVLLPEGFIRLR